MASGGRLTALKVSKVKSPGMYPDGDGLYLQIAKGGSKSWIFRYRPRKLNSQEQPNRSREMGLGSVKCDGRVGGAFTLAEARERAAAQRKLLADGFDPIEQRKMTRAEAAAVRSFKSCAEEYIESHTPGWKNEKHAGQWTSTLEKWAYPIVGDLAVNAVTTDHVMKVLEQKVAGDDGQPRFWEARTETANRVRGRIEKVLDWATARKLRHGDNPARWTGLIETLLPRKSQVAPVEHHKALPYAELPKFMAALRSRDSVSARALEFTILTVARTNDTIGAARSEIDQKAKAWIVSAERLKGKKGARKRDHYVPLSARAMQIVAGRPKDAEILFAGAAGQPLSNMAMLELLQDMGFGEDLTVHGFRSSFKDWCSEQTAYPNEMSEMALAHTVSDKVEAAYRRGDMREKRQRLMEDWATFCAGKPIDGSNVVPIRA